MNNCSLDQLTTYEDGVIRCSRSKSLLSDITRYLNLPSAVSSRQNVELGLEIEINESVQRVLKDDTSSDDLLAVTIIRPSESDLVHETTVALNKKDVKEFIALVEKHRTKRQHSDKKSERDAKKLTKKDRERERERGKERDRKHKGDKKETKNARRESKLEGLGSKETVANRPESKDRRKKSKSTTKRPEDPREATPTGRHSSKISKVHMSTFGENAKQVYTTINTFDKLKEVLPCQNKHRSDKPGVPCICQNCGIMDVLVQSQKGPVVEFPPLEEVRQSDRDRDKKERHRKDKKETKGRNAAAPSNLDIDILKEINVRITNLEKRLAIQEETAVSKDYLKHVLHKIFSQCKND